MRFFKTNIHGGCYHEFFQGEWDGETFWSETSLYLHDDHMTELGLYRNLFAKAIPNFDRYANFKVSREDWENITRLAGELGGGILGLIEELTPWAEDNFRKYEVFTVIGI